ncbi:geranylgeranyl pyrophosphate synthase [Rhodothalassium salexigens]|uniref:polyprenyl synthetase family protein n=1 Tax=Rhodothalassium salexigens TaxID=1086 RepID=UPI001912C9C9|nr:polyprenyl synthetase family protein [Rhodothalassium salexigens]MBK5912387.1 geranylgeranyl pyrophosphate synthase [Rhodothalassium salexigens]MBK5919991.1 geranylgeranyl pyrophosphate synthase [Rhodothalassium salexigens]
MDPSTRIERTLAQALDRGEGPGSPPLLAAAMRHAVMPGGARIRPKLTLAVAAACGEPLSPAVDGAAAGIELLHCASLIHDDLPCFDNADMRRGKPSVHKKFGERLAVLAGDALIVMAFDAVAHGVAEAETPERAGPLMAVLAQSVGAPMGIAAGQAWECEPRAELSAYQQAKTGSLFAGATVAGAAAAGQANHEAWRGFGERLGEAYQVADDIRDVAGNAEDEGKPVGQDGALGRPNAAMTLGLRGAVQRLTRLVDGATAEIPACPGRTALVASVEQQAQAFLPKAIWALAD